MYFYVDIANQIYDFESNLLSKEEESALVAFRRLECTFNIPSASERNSRKLQTLQGIFLFDLDVENPDGIPGDL